MARMVNCVKLGHEAEGLDFPPYPGELGNQRRKAVWAALRPTIFDCEILTLDPAEFTQALT